MDIDIALGHSGFLFDFQRNQKNRVCLKTGLLKRRQARKSQPGKNRNSKKQNSVEMGSCLIMRF
jgi:hypothetical protein